MILMKNVTMILYGQIRRSTHYLPRFRADPEHMDVNYLFNFKMIYSWSVYSILFYFVLLI